MKRQVPFAPVAVVALLIVAAVGFFLLVKPQMDESGALDGQIAQLQQQVDTALAAQQQPAPTDETIRVADVFRLSKAMPDETAIGDVMLELNAVAAAAGVDFLSISPQPAVPNEAGYQLVPIKLTFEGNFYDLSDFLFRVRNLVSVRDGELDVAGRLFTLDAFDLHAGTQGFPQIAADLTVSVYTYGAAPGSTAATTTSPASTTPTTTATTTTPDASAAGTG